MRSKKIWAYTVFAAMVACATFVLCAVSAYADDGQDQKQIDIIDLTPEDLQDMIQYGQVERELVAGADMELSAFFIRQGTTIISSVVPTNLSIAVSLDASNGTFKKGTAATSSIENKASSSFPVRIDIAEVNDVPAVGASRGILHYSQINLDATRSGTNPNGSVVSLSDSMAPATLYSRIAPGETSEFLTQVDANPDHINETIIPGKYTTQVIMKVSALPGQ